MPNGSHLVNRYALLTASAVAVVGFTAGFAPAGEKKPQKFARFAGPDGKPVFGVLEGDSLREITGAPYGEWRRTDRVVPASGVKFLPVTDARTVYALAGNYQDHLAGLPPERLEKYKTPQFFLKTPASLCGHGDDVRYPKDAGRVDYEGELVIVIGKGGRDIPKEKALDHVFGVAAGNDVSARDWQSNDIQWWRAKGSDTFGPCGPYIATGIDYGNLDLQVRVNGEVKMRTNTKLMVHDIPTSVSFLSRHVTLQPGDLIFTGTAGKTQPIKVGDVVEVELEGAGVLRNKVAGE
jgi:2-keto-4-pentenoate hydratase/2-oxohepta-3-ene-1,7-dioic acid hydratase in catechol pathway